MPDDLREEIEEYIRGHDVCTIAIADGKKPSAHTMYYVNEGLHIYMESNPQSQKIHILRANPNISLTIDEDYQDWRNIKGIQLSGKAKITDEEHAPRLQRMFTDKFPHLNEMGGIPDHHVFIQVKPEKIYYMDFTKRFGKKHVYHVDETSLRINW